MGELTYRVDSLEDLIEMWKKDTDIDPNIGKAVRKIASLHGKYLAILTWYRAKYKATRIEVKKKRHIKRQYYSGLLSKEQLTALGLEPFSLKILKQDLDTWMEGDEEILKLESKMDFHNEVVSFCEYVIKELNNRTWQLKTAFEYERFTSGN